VLGELLGHSTADIRGLEAEGGHLNIWRYGIGATRNG
jgi:hypothetical protein